MSLIKNSAWNILGFLIPSLIALPAMGIMARILGVEKFGVFTLAFTVLGYAGIFDGGLTRAVIRSVAMHHGDVQQNRKVVGTASCTVLFLGALAAVLLFASAENITRILNVSSNSYSEVVNSLRWLSLSIPPFLLGMIWFSYLEGSERFAELNILKTVTNSLIALLPLIAALIHKSLMSAILGLIAGRIVAMYVAYIPFKRDMPGGPWVYDQDTLKKLLKFGGWITVSNIISPLMVNFDRFILSNLVGAQSVAFYTAPSEAVARISIIPRAVAGSLFPVLSKGATESGQQSKIAFWGILGVCSTIILPLFIFSDLILTLWMGPQFKGEAGQVLRILLIGFLFNAIAIVPYSKIQAHGHSRTTAIVHLVEFIPYIALLFWSVSNYSIAGAAIAWSIRVMVDFVLLQYLSRKV